MVRTLVDAVMSLNDKNQSCVSVKPTFPISTLLGLP